jgi:energy-coupling factor transporter ATP-binding protein EcfA2
MPSIIAIVTIIGLAIALIATIHQLNTLEPSNNDYWYDTNNHYNEYTSSHTDNIDRYIMAHCTVRKKITLEHGRQVPGYDTYTINYNNIADGSHYGSVGIIKISKKINNQEITNYRTFSSDKLLLKKFNDDIAKFQTSQGEVNVMSIDTSGDSPSIVIIPKLCGTPKPNQEQAIDKILEHWTEENHFNTKVVLFGQRGVGKTYIPKLLKKLIQEKDQSINPLLFDDFNPSSIAVNINTMALQKADKTTPVIIVIDEIDTVFDKVISGQETHDHRLQHSRNKQDFHQMLDGIGNKKNVIAIYTMERNPVELYKDNNYASFLRKGRVDFFVEVQQNESIVFHQPENIINEN